MAEFLLEIFSEEIPARMQEKAAANLLRLVTDRLDQANIPHQGVSSYVTARRLTLHIENVATEQPDIAEEKRGPRTDAPDAAVDGFMRGAGVSRDQLVTREEKKGTFFYAMINEKGRKSAEIIADFMPEIICNFPWPKSQRWGAGALRWVRPMHNILCLLDKNVVEFDVDNIKSTNITYGHRFMAPNAIEINSFANYCDELRKAFVILDRNERIDLIKKDAAILATDAELVLVDDVALLNEVAGLAEYPVVLLGAFDDEFLDVPPEALTSAMRTHQKYFSLQKPDGSLASKFIFVSNMKTDDDGAKIIDGNQRVLRARLGDTKFFWDQDLKSTLADHLPALDDIVFHAKLGTVGERVKRLEHLAGYIAKTIGADIEQARMAAKLSKSDLVTGMVDECPELQGLMGKYFALEEGLDGFIADGIADHYSPKGPSDICPSNPVSIAVALAEKVDTLVGFFAIGEKPTGSKDPFALRRASLGIIRLVIENGVRIDLENVMTEAAKLYNLNSDIEELRSFFWDRLKVYAKDKDIRHDVIGAEFNWDFVKLMAKANAVQKFITTDDGMNLLVGYKRAANILSAEEKKEGLQYKGIVNNELLNIDEEKILFDALLTVNSEVEIAVSAEQFEEAMACLSSLRTPIDNFFDMVTVNSDEQSVRVNRLELLSQIRTTMNLVVEFSKIEG